MKRKYKTFYEVQIPNKWWCGKKIGWITNLKNIKYHFASSSRYFRTSRRATAHTIISPIGTILMKWGYKNGKRYLKEYKMKELLCKRNS